MLSCSSKKSNFSLSMLHDLISKTQLVFVSGRIISDNIACPKSFNGSSTNPSSARLINGDAVYANIFFFFFGAYIYI